MLEMKFGIVNGSPIPEEDMEIDRRLVTTFVLLCCLQLTLLIGYIKLYNKECSISSLDENVDDELSIDYES